MYHIIINPASRSGRASKIWKEQVEPVLLAENIPYKAYFSKKAGDISRIADEILSSHEESPLSFIILGGDGTVNEAIQGIRDTSRVILGYIPTGSSNDLARDLKLPKDPGAALERILHSGTPHPMDLGTVTYADGEKRRFAVSCGIGFDAAVCEEVQRSRIKKVMNKLGLGKLTYLGIALRQRFASRAVSATLTIGNNAPVNVGNMLFVACMLHRFEGGGFMFAPNAKTDDGILNMCAVGDLSRLFILLALPTAFKGKHYRFKGITPYEARSLTIETTLPLWVHTDGEVSRQSDRITVTCEKHAIQFIY